MPKAMFLLVFCVGDVFTEPAVYERENNPRIFGRKRRLEFVLAGAVRRDRL